MPTSTMTEESEYPLPKGIYFPARLQSVQERTITYGKKDKNGVHTGEEGQFTKWIWEFQITDGDYARMKAWGETEDRLTNREDNLVRQWAEALLDREIQLGETFDTESVVGLPCMISVRHDPPRVKRDGGKFYGCPVDEVLPVVNDDDSPPF